MKAIFCFALLFLVTLRVEAKFEPEVTGEWKNELDSVMKLHLNNDGTIDGSYYSMVGNVSGTYPLNGFFNKDSAIMGWTVMWNNGIQNSNSVTTWVSQYFPDKNCIISTWILRSEVSDILDEWKSTNVGMDVFVKIK